MELSWVASVSPARPVGACLQQEPACVLSVENWLTLVYAHWREHTLCCAASGVHKCRLDLCLQDWWGCEV